MHIPSMNTIQWVLSSSVLIHFSACSAANNSDQELTLHHNRTNTITTHTMLPLLTPNMHPVDGTPISWNESDPQRTNTDSSLLKTSNVTKLDSVDSESETHQLPFLGISPLVTIFPYGLQHKQAREDFQVFLQQSDIFQLNPFHDMATEIPFNELENHTFTNTTHSYESYDLRNNKISSIEDLFPIYAKAYEHTLQECIREELDELDTRNRLPMRKDKFKVKLHTAVDKSKGRNKGPGVNFDYSQDQLSLLAPEGVFVSVLTSRINKHSKKVGDTPKWKRIEDVLPYNYPKIRQLKVIRNVDVYSLGPSVGHSMVSKYEEFPEDPRIQQLRVKQIQPRHVVFGVLQYKLNFELTREDEDTVEVAREVLIYNTESPQSQETSMERDQLIQDMKEMGLRFSIEPVDYWIDFQSLGVDQARTRDSEVASDIGEALSYCFKQVNEDVWGEDEDEEVGSSDGHIQRFMSFEAKASVLSCFRLEAVNATMITGDLKLEDISNLSISSILTDSSLAPPTPLTLSNLLISILASNPDNTGNWISIKIKWNPP
ncbi:hypothetical protein WICPIJ_005784 [Wickerhamomyces pijperi]|uniref:Secreted protein n=1 Tax=Wickerhamomyces pijperi TaxID=599730 RepID=A0A9P8TM12_WICPI|nr:hypothetical protein WICPIJ_005784 [Wickerhamomyces pijperi]